jgi:hypothetical protein
LCERLPVTFVTLEDGGAHSSFSIDSRKEVVVRLEGHMKCGYYPTPPDVTGRIRRLVSLPEEPLSALDPCAGEGLALADLVRGSGAVTFGIELDRRRASRAKRRLDHAIRGDFFRCRVSPKSASLVLLNPPYADDEDGRLEFRFLKAALSLVRPGGVLVYLIPQRRLTERVARVLAGHFEKVRVSRFPDPEFDRFRQIAVIGTKRAAAVAVSMDDLPSCLQGVPLRELKPLPARPKAAYDVPPSPPIRTFKSNEIDEEALAEELAVSKLGRADVGSRDVGRDRPPVPLHAGHVALLLAAGELDGVVGKGKGRHVVRGYVKKTVDMTQDEDEKGNQTIRETERFEVQIKTLSRDGEIRVLSGAQSRSSCARIRGIRSSSSEFLGHGGQQLV